jgi:hypothetical protein
MQSRAAASRDQCVVARHAASRLPGCRRVSMLRVASQVKSTDTQHEFMYLNTDTQHESMYAVLLSTRRGVRHGQAYGKLAA